MRMLKNLFIALSLMSALCISAIAQTSPASSRPNASTGANDEQLIARLLGEVKAGRALVATQKEQLAALEAQAETQRVNGISLSASYTEAAREITHLRQSIGLMEKVIGLHEQTVAILQSREDELKKEVKRQRKRATLSTLVAIGSVALRFL